MLRAICLSLLVLAVVMGSTAGFKTRSSAVGSRSSRLLAGFGGGVRGADGGVSGAPPSAHARCPCNSDGKLAYKDCCQPYHTGAAINTPETLIRSRFSAFASGNTDYIIASSSPRNPDYDYHLKSTPTGRDRALRNWAKEIRRTMVDGFKYIRMEVVDVAYESEERCEATSRFLSVSSKIGGGERFPIEEIIQMDRGPDGGWLYSGSQAKRPDPEISAAMMVEWPALAGVDIKFIDGDEGEDMIQRVLNKKIDGEP